MDKKIIENNLKTEIIGKEIVCYDIIDSTQEEVKRNSYLGNGTVIIAERQTKGKGTHGRVWYTDTEYKNIAKSLILFPECKISKLKEITIIIAKCIVRTFEKLYNLKLQIKEPNDKDSFEIIKYYLSTKKISKDVNIKNISSKLPFHLYPLMALILVLFFL